ncbi:MAG: hypothetical protein ACP5K5_00940 [Candidatus Micrarchaeia archaeon]
MGFFGLLVAIIFVFLVVLFAKEAQMLRYASLTAYAEEAYSNKIALEALNLSAISTKPSNSLLYGSWLNALEASAYQDSINIYIANGIIIVSNSNKPSFSTGIKIGN